MGINWNYPTTMWIGENRIEDLSLAYGKSNWRKCGRRR